MSTRTALTVVGGVVGAYFGYPQLGLVVGGLIGGIVDPTVIPGPKIGEISVQTSADGVPRPIIYGSMACYGNVIQTGQAVKVEGDDGGGKGEPEQATGDQVYRTYAIRICEGPVAALLRVWEDNKLVCDFRTGSPIVADSNKWMSNKVFYYGDETQLPDPTLVATVSGFTPSYRGTCYMVFNTENLTSRIGSIPQYRFEVATVIDDVHIDPIIDGPGNDTPGYWIDVNFDDDGNILMLRDQQTGANPTYSVSTPPSGSFTIATYDKESINTQLDYNTIANGGDIYEPGADQRMGVTAISYNGGYQFSAEGIGTNAGNRLLAGGVTVAHLLDYTGTRNWGSESLFGPGLYGGLVFMTDSSIYIGLARSGYNSLHKWPLAAGSPDLNPSAYLLDPISTSGSLRFSVSNQGTVRLVDAALWTNILEYNENLVYQQTVSSVGNPTSIGVTASNIYVFGADDDMEIIAYLYHGTGFDIRCAIFGFNGNLLTDQLVISGDANYVGIGSYKKILFTPTHCLVAMRHRFWAIPISSLYDPATVPLSEIVSDIHDRCGIDASMYDVSELTDEVAGFMLAGEYTGADAINSPKLVYFYDKSEHDKALYYPKRGAAVIETLTVDDLTEIPDSTVREQAIEIPKKLHLKYQHANSGYAPVKATVVSSSPDVLTTGEVSIEVPIVLDEDQAIQTADKMYKVTRAELYGQTEVVVPLYVGAKYVTGNCVGLSLRGSTKRMRIEEMVLTPDWQMKLTLKPDRQSAYTSNLTGVPIPDPTPPPSTIIGETELAVLDIPARVDFEDDLNYLVAVSGALPPWYGARYQRSFDGGANYTTVQDITTASIMGELLESVPDASEYFTDTTNEVNVSLFRVGQTLSSITEQEFLSEGNPFALEKPDGSWEVMQFQNAHENSDGTWTLTTLHRGQLSSGTSSHNVGAKFVMLQRPSHIAAQSAWIGQAITHRAISLGENADDTNNDVTQTFVGRSQIEWTVASLKLTRDVNDVSATWEPRHRFGTANSPIASINFQGYRVTIDGGSQGAVTFDTTNNFFTDYDTSALGPDVVVSVSALNRITGAGPSTSKTI